MNSKNQNQLTALQLDRQIKSLAGQERELLCQVIQTIQEIHRRRSYLDLGFANLYSYLTEGIGYSTGSAHRRIEAARLVTEIPEILAEIKSGDLKLTQVTLVQHAAREKTKISPNPVTTQDKQEILKQITHHNFEHSQQQVAAYFDLPIKDQTKLKIQADQSIRMELTIPTDLFEDMKKAQGLISHSVPSADWVSYLRYVTDQTLKQKTKVKRVGSKIKKPKKSANRRPDKIDIVAADVEISVTDTNPTGPFVNHSENLPKTTNVASNEYSTVENQIPLADARKNFTPRQRKILLSATDRCQFQDPVTHKQCGSLWFLQIDHKQSKWAGGLNTLDNAQVLCAQHNRQKYEREARIYRK